MTGAGNITRMISAIVHWRCEHGKRRDEPCAECVASLLFDLKYRPKHYEARTRSSRCREELRRRELQKSAWRR